MNSNTLLWIIFLSTVFSLMLTGQPSWAVPPVDVNIGIQTENTSLSPAAGPLQINRIELRFMENNQGDITVPVNGTVTPQTIIKYSGNGPLTYQWLVDGRVIQQRSMSVVNGFTGSVGIWTSDEIPSFPTFEPGYHNVSLRLLAPAFPHTIPTIRYFVDSTNKMPEKIVLLRPIKGQIVYPDELNFSWKTPAAGQIHRLTIWKDNDFVLSALTKKQQYSLPPNLLQRLEKNTKYSWWIEGLNDQGEVIAKSLQRQFSFRAKGIVAFKSFEINPLPKPAITHERSDRTREQSGRQIEISEQLTPGDEVILRAELENWQFFSANDVVVDFKNGNTLIGRRVVPLLVPGFFTSTELQWQVPFPNNKQATNPGSADSLILSDLKITLEAYVGNQLTDTARANIQLLPVSQAKSSGAENVYAGLDFFGTFDREVNQNLDFSGTFNREVSQNLDFSGTFNGEVSQNLDFYGQFNGEVLESLDFWGQFKAELFDFSGFGKNDVTGVDFTAYALGKNDVTGVDFTAFALGKNDVTGVDFTAYALGKNDVTGVDFTAFALGKNDVTGVDFTAYALGKNDVTGVDFTAFALGKNDVTGVDFTAYALGKNDVTGVDFTAFALGKNDVTGIDFTAYALGKNDVTGVDFTAYALGKNDVTGVDFTAYALGKNDVTGVDFTAYALGKNDVTGVDFTAYALGKNDVTGVDFTAYALGKNDVTGVDFTASVESVDNKATSAESTDSTAQESGEVSPDLDAILATTPPLTPNVQAVAEEPAPEANIDTPLPLPGIAFSPMETRAQPLTLVGLRNETTPPLAEQSEALSPEDLSAVQTTITLEATSLALTLTGLRTEGIIDGTKVFFEPLTVFGEPLSLIGKRTTRTAFTNLDVPTEPLRLTGKRTIPAIFEPLTSQSVVLRLIGIR